MQSLKTLGIAKIFSSGKWPSRQKPASQSQQRAWSSNGVTPNHVQGLHFLHNPAFCSERDELQRDGWQPVQEHRCPFCPQCMENAVHHHSGGSSEKGSYASNCPLAQLAAFCVSSQNRVGTHNEYRPTGDQLVPRWSCL